MQIKRLIVLHCDVIRWHRKVVFLERAGGKRCFFGNGVVVVVRNKISKRRAAPR